MSDRNELKVRVREYLETNRERIFSAAAPGVEPEIYISKYMLAIVGTPGALECHIDSHAFALTDAACLGLAPGKGVDGLSYPVPFKNRITLIPGYLGLIKLAYDSPLVAGVDSQMIYHGDKFKVSLGTRPCVKHEPTTDRRDKPLAVYSILWLTSGIPRVVYMNWADVMAHKDKNSAGSNRGTSPWVTHAEPMALKTALRKVLKFAPLSNEARRVLQQAEYSEEGVDDGTLKSGDAPPQDDLDAFADYAKSGKATTISEATPEAEGFRSLAEPANVACDSEGVPIGGGLFDNSPEYS